MLPATVLFATGIIIDCMFFIAVVAALARKTQSASGIVAWHTLVLSLLLSISYLLTVPEGFMPESSNIACVVQSYVGDFAATGASMLAFFSALVLWWMTHPRTRLLGTDRARRRSSARLVTIILVVCYSTPALLQVASVFQDRYPLGGMCTPGTLMWETVSRSTLVASGALSKRHGATSSLSNTTPTNQEPRVPTGSSSGANFARHGLAVSTGSSAVGIATTGLPTSAGRLCEELAVSERSLVARGGSPRASSRGGTTASSGRFPFRNTESGRALAVAAASIDRPSGGATYVPPSASQALRDALSNARFPNPPTGVLRAWATDAVAEPDEPTKLEALARLRTAERAREALAVTDEDLAVANALKTIQGTATASPMAGASDDGHEHDATAVPGSPSHPGALLSAAAGELSDGGPSSAAVHEAVVRRLVLAGGMGQRGRDLTTRRNKTKPYGSSAMSEGATSAGTSVLSPSARDDNSDSGRARADDDDGDDGDDDRSGRVRSGMTAASGFDSSNSVWETPDNEQQRRRLLRMGLFSVESEEGDGASGERGRGGASDSAGLPMPLVPFGASASSHQLASLATARVAGATGVVVGVSSMSRNGVGSEAAVASLVRRSRGSASGTVGGRGSMASSAGLRGPLSQASAGAARPVKATPPGVWAVEGATADASWAPAAAHCSPSSLPATGATESTAAGASSTKQAGVLDAGALPDFGSVDVTSPEAGAPNRSGQAAKAGRQGPSPEGAASTRGAGVVAALMAADSEFDIPAVSGSSAGAGGGRGASSATESTLFFDSSVPVAKGGTPVRPKRRNRDCKRAARCVCQSTRWLGQGFVTLSTCGCCGCEEEFRSSAVVASTLFTSVLPVLGLLSAENSFAAQNPTATLLDFPRYEYQDMVALPPEMRTISRAFVARMIVRVALQMWLGLLLTAEHATSKLVFSVILDLLGCSFHDGDGDTVASDSEGPPSGRRRGSGRQSHLARGSFRQTSALPGASDDSTLARTLANRSGSSPSGPTVVPSGILGGSLNRFGLEPVSSAGSWPTAASDSMSDSSSRKLPRARHSEGSAGVVYGPDGAIIERLEPWVAGGLAFSVARTVPDVPVSACGGGVGSGQRSAVLSRAASHRKSKRQLLHPDDGSGKKVSAAAGRDVTQAQTLPSAVSRRMAAAHSPDSGHNAGPSQAWYRALLHRERPGEAHAPWSGKGPP
ncbi:hypothetical protein FNF29_04714 [Cafeteria roenbergensis]|uniref:Uncharacterized protein n=1 Tax=Cafeteria roenbergensis TaxID=33653 RepID=A0A5A8CEU8_CAFRO|nr:hypothetical protein FNF29_04714 [Cafeteria roenbergensis]|eukprot:KAA0151239.1 hypothetical protein FNF29_04714 [Cafeteria roenbergensis]